MHKKQQTFEQKRREPFYTVFLYLFGRIILG